MSTLLTWSLCMRKLVASFLLVSLLSGVLPVTPTGAQADPAGVVVVLVNVLRASKGLATYRADATLTAVAQAQAVWSAANNHIGHDGPGGNRPRDRALAGGYGGGSSISVQENVAHGTLPYVTPDWVVTMWQGDDIHLGALLSANHDDIGVGYAEANGAAWYVMMIGRVGSGSVAPTKQPQPRQETPVIGDATAVPVAPARLNTPGPDGSIRHEVQAGQTAWTVAAYYGIDLQELLALNSLTEDAILQPGDVLLIHPPSVAASATPSRASGAGMPTVTQAATITPSPTLPSEENATDGSPVVIWGLLAAAGVVLVGSGARAAYILRRWRSPDE